MTNFLYRYQLPSPEVDKALQKCEKDLNAIQVEERLGFEVGKRVMLKIVAKYGSMFYPKIA